MDWLKLLSHHRLNDKKNQRPTGNEIRSAFEQDYDRIIFSHPFRKLQDKTQVFPLPEHDFVHTRLTHSLEVSSVGRSLGKKVGERIISTYPELQTGGYTQFDFGAIVAAASLAHDLGNPPFGHSGEEALSDFFKINKKGLFFKDKMTTKQWSDVTTFEGNAQGFRILTKGKQKGLALTLATLATFTKYPSESLITDRKPELKSQKKYGIFQTEKSAFENLANKVGLKNLSTNGDRIWSRHPLAFLVEAADDICYSIIDLEDGCRLGLVSYEQTRDLLGTILGEKYQPEKLNKIHSANERIGLLRALAIGILIDQSAAIFLENEKEILAGNFDQALTDLIPAKDILHEITGISVEKIYRSRVVLETEAAGFEVIDGLLEAFLPACYAYHFDKKSSTAKEKNLVRLLPTEIFIGLLDDENTTYELIMNVIDYISGMTDTHAISLYRKIKGITLPTGFPVKF